MVCYFVTRAVQEVGAYPFAGSARASPQSELSERSRKWLTVLARIKFQIDEAALEGIREISQYNEHS